MPPRRPDGGHARSLNATPYSFLSLFKKDVLVISARLSRRTYLVNSRRLSFIVGKGFLSNSFTRWKP